jgi:hypothetical protein
VAKRATARAFHLTKMPFFSKALFKLGLTTPGLRRDAVLRVLRDYVFRNAGPAG